MLPTCCRPHGTTRELLAEICKLVENFVGLPEKSASLVGRFVLCSWLVEAVQVAPALVLVGPDIDAGESARCAPCIASVGMRCRMTGLTPAGLRSLPSGAGFTFLISQPTISDKLRKAARRCQPPRSKDPVPGWSCWICSVPRSFTPNRFLAGESLSPRSIQIPMIPGGAATAGFRSRCSAPDHDRFSSEIAEFPAREPERRVQTSVRFIEIYLPHCASSPIASPRQRRTMPNCKPKSSTCSERKTKKFAPGSGSS